MTTLRRLSYAALGVAYTHLVFGAIVRISGSGMGCGDNWPKCQGYWFPPMNRPDLIIEVSHRYLASLLFVALASLAIAAWRKRREPGVSGPGGVLRMAFAAAALWFGVALLGALTVFMGNPPYATLAHWSVAMSLVAVLITAAIRAGALGGENVRTQRVGGRAARSAYFAAGLAFLAVVMGGLTAKYPSAAVGCLKFPLCGPNPAAPGAPHHIQLTHRIIAYLLFFHLLGVVMAGRKRNDSTVVKRAGMVAFGFVLLQMLVAGAMIGMHLPPVFRSLHEAVGVAIWLSSYAFAYLAHLAYKGTTPDGTPAHLEPAPRPGAPIEAPAGVVKSASASASELPTSGRIVAPTPQASAREATARVLPVSEPVAAGPALSLVTDEPQSRVEHAEPAEDVEVQAPPKLTLVQAEPEPTEAVSPPEAAAALEERAAQATESPAAQTEAAAPLQSRKRPHTVAHLVARGADL